MGNIKNRTNYFFDYMINIKDFHLSLPKVNKKSYKNIWYLLYWINIGSV